MGAGNEKIARNRAENPDNFLKQSTKKDLEFFDKISNEEQFRDLFDPYLVSYPVDQEKERSMDGLLDTLIYLPPFGPVDRTHEGEVDDTAKNIEMNNLLRRYFLSIL